MGWGADSLRQSASRPLLRLCTWALILGRDTLVQMQRPSLERAKGLEPPRLAPHLVPHLAPSSYAHVCVHFTARAGAGPGGPVEDVSAQLFK